MDAAERLAVLGYQLYNAARFEEAEQVFTELTRRTPRDAMQWCNLGTSRRSQGKLNEALAAFSRAAELGARSANFYYNVGLVHLDRRDYESARAVLGRALELTPRDTAVRLEYVKACYESARTDEALTALEQAPELDELEGSALAQSAQQLINVGASERALRAAQRLMRTDSLDARARLTLAHILERTNRIEEARSTLQALEQDPNSAALGADLMALQGQLAQREARHEAACEFFERALAGTSDAVHKHLIQYPLARSLDALGRCAEAFAMLEAAHVSQYEHLRLTAPTLAARGFPPMALLDHPSDPQDIARWDERGAPAAEHSPIFVVAFPRSGTTLLEVALDAHPQVRSMDEQPFVHDVLEDLMAAGARYPERLADVDAAELERIRARYWERVGRRVSLSAGQRLVDKNPLNMMRLAAIRRVFPNAPILLAIRHPCDVLLSCFMQNFRAPEFALLCRTLPMLATAYRRTFDFWYAQQALLQPQCLELRYETFVTDFPQQMRRIAAFCGLPWDDALLRPHQNARNKGYIGTPSYSQVVKPVDGKAVGRWQRYREQFAPVLPTLRPYLERWGYDS